jgi:hypothetical protein
VGKASPTHPQEPHIVDEIQKWNDAIRNTYTKSFYLIKERGELTAKKWTRI